MIGAPQNILRHPDMPASAFADLWATIKAGLPWMGLVKNRRKNGQYYWVLAIVTPIVENGKCIGYTSVRTKPTREQVMAAHNGPLGADEYRITLETESWLIEMYAAFIAAAPSAKEPQP